MPAILINIISHLGRLLLREKLYYVISFRPGSTTKLDNIKIHRPLSGRSIRLATEVVYSRSSNLCLV